MNDADKTESSDSTASDSGAEEASTSKTDPSAQKSTLAGPGFRLPAPGGDSSEKPLPSKDSTSAETSDTAGERQKRRKSLSSRLKKLAARSTPDKSDGSKAAPDDASSSSSAIGEDSKSETNLATDEPAQNLADEESAPDLDTKAPVSSDETPPTESGEFDPDSTDQSDYGQKTDRLESLPFDIVGDQRLESSTDSSATDSSATESSATDQEYESEAGDRDERGDQSTLMMHSSVEEPSSAPQEVDDSSTDTTDAQDLDDEDFADQATELISVDSDCAKSDGDDHADSQNHVEASDETDRIDPDSDLFDADFLNSEESEESEDFEDEQTQISPSPGEDFSELSTLEDAPLDHGLAEDTQNQEMSARPHGDAPFPSGDRSRPKNEDIDAETLQPSPESESPFEKQETDLSSGLVEDTDASSPPPPEIQSSDTGPKHRPPSPISPASDSTDAQDDFSARTGRPDSNSATASVTDTSAEFEVGDTEIYESPFENDPICPRLSTLEGPLIGQQFLITGMRNSIGRGTSNSIVVTDPSMSRKHFEIVQKSDDTYAVHDLMAVNGTSLNGVPIKEADLFHGDRIETGQSVFQFLIPGDAPVNSRQRHLVPAESTKTMTAQADDSSTASRSAASGAKKSTLDRVLLITTIVAGLLCIPLVGFLVHTVVFDEQPEAVSTQSALELYSDGVRAIQNQQWDRAEQLFDQTYDIDPDFGAIDAMHDRIARGRQAQTIIEQARQQPGHMLGDDILNDLRSISDDSPYFDDAQSLLGLQRQEEANELFAQAQQAYDDDDIETTYQALNELQAVAPRHEGAQELRDTIESSSGDEQDSESGTEEVEQQHPRAAQPQHQPRSRTQRSDSSPGDEDDESLALLLDRSPDSRSSGDRDSTANTRPRNINFTEGFTLYRSERFDDAIAHFEAIAHSSRGAVADRASKTADEIRQYATAVDAGIDARDAGRYHEAIDYFQQARQADQTVAGGGGSFADEVGTYLASTLAFQGFEKLEVQDYSAAFELMERARAHDANNSETIDLKDRLESEANSLYIRAVNQRKSDPDGAAQICHTILTMVPTSSDIYHRARRMLDTLE